MNGRSLLATGTAFRAQSQSWTHASLAAWGRGWRSPVVKRRRLTPQSLAYRRGAWWAWIGLGAVTVAASVLAGLLGPITIAVYGIVLSLPVWGSWWWLAHNG